MHQVTIMIGLPKSGKSTWARKNVDRGYIVSADSFFEPDYAVNFQRDRLPHAHQACFRSFLRAIGAGEMSIVVDNTNLSNWERAPYVLAAQTYGYDVRFVVMDVSAAACIARPDNGHGVPDDVIDRMDERFEDVLPFWPGADSIVKVGAR